MDTFPLDKADSPCIVSVYGSKTAQEMMSLYKRFNEKRVLQPIITTLNPNPARKPIFLTGNKVWVFYNSSRNAEEAR